MAYNMELAEHIRKVLSDTPVVVEKKMFGGFSFPLTHCGLYVFSLKKRE